MPPVTFSLCADGLPTDGMWKCDPVLSDVNGDGMLDVAAIPRLGKGPRLWLGDGKGSWTMASQGLTPDRSSCGGGIEVADINRDGFPDLAVADHCQGVFVYLGDGAGSWRAVTKAMHPEAGQDGLPEDYAGSEDLDVGDANGDGFLDLVAIAQDRGGIMVYLGDGSGERWEHRPLPGLSASAWGNRVAFHDLNQDGRLDIVASMGEGPRVWLNDGQGGWTASSGGLPAPIDWGIFTGFDVGDVDGDGRLDLVTANWIDGPEVFLQQEDGSWKTAPDAFPEMMGGAIGVKLGDVDLDGKLDMVVSGRFKYEVGFVYGLFFLKGDGQNNWRYIKGTNLPETGLSTAWGVTLGDVNLDGVLDIVYATGGVVPADPRHADPVIPTRLQVWCAQLSGGERAVLANARR